ncbi:MAG TPA: FmdB family zinc ribbon protein [Bryobacteraceae bacterium]|nr:FmdB family zinc ribbon protein [Bryobacteraceae bacterium]
MPMYEYHCLKCGKNFDVLQRFSDAPLTTHEECGGAVERVLSAPAFQLKGSGWYASDYGKGGKKPADGDGSDKKTDDSKPAEVKAESKSDSKSESTTGSGSGPKPESKKDSGSKGESKTSAKTD